VRGARRAKTAAPSLVELFRIFNALRRDPSLRLSESGRALLRTLESCALVARDRNKIVATVPSHCAESMARLAHGYAEVWSAFAADLTRHAAEARRIADESGEATPLGA
jgi:hypothetical protein